MKIILAMVISINGKSTKGDLPDQSWASVEDSQHLSKLISENNLILMGGKTYQFAKSHIKPREGKLRVVVTHDPEKFSADEVDGQLEFTNLSIPELVKDLEDRGFKQMLLLSGEGLNKQFFQEGLVDEIILTVEPKVFGSGKGILAESNLDINLQLLEMEKLNEQGTILLRYKVVK